MPGSSELHGTTALATLQYSATAAPPYTVLAKLIDVTPPESTTESYDVTSTEITDRTRRFIPGWIDGGSCSGELLMTQAEVVALKAIADGGLTYGWQISWTDPAYTETAPAIKFNGFIESGPTAITPIADRWTLSVSIKLDGPWEFIPGTNL